MFLDLILGNPFAWGYTVCSPKSICTRIIKSSAAGISFVLLLNWFRTLRVKKKCHLLESQFTGQTIGRQQTDFNPIRFHKCFSHTYYVYSPTLPFRMFTAVTKTRFQARAPYSILDLRRGADVMTADLMAKPIAQYPCLAIQALWLT